MEFDLITNSEVVKLFSNGSFYNIVLFIFFVIFVIILVTANRERKYNAKANKDLTDVIRELTQVITKSTTKEEEKNVLYIEEFNMMRGLMSQIEASLSILNVSIKELHCWCMAKNSPQGEENNEQDTE